MPLKIMLIAAETSGDMLGADLARALKARAGEGAVLLSGVGGERMKAEGIDSPFDITELSVLGWIEGLMAYGRVRKRVADTVAHVRALRPDAVVLIDSWGFTIRVAKAIRAQMPEIRLIKYVGPQVWASRPGRAATLAASVDHLLALYPFDAPWFEREGLATTVVGSPALHTDFSHADGAAFRAARAIAPDTPLLLVLPGSRRSEVLHLMPVFEQAVLQLKDRHPALQVAVLAAPGVESEVRGRAAGWPLRTHIVTGEDRRDAMKAAHAALACSGTVSTELALAGVPMVIAYRLGALSYAIMKPLVTVEHITLFNLAAGRRIAPEFVQDQATPDALAGAVNALLSSPEAAAAQSRAQAEALTLMGKGARDPSDVAAEAVLAVLEQRK